MVNDAQHAYYLKRSTKYEAYLETAEAAAEAAARDLDTVERELRAAEAEAQVMPTKESLRTVRITLAQLRTAQRVFDNKTAYAAKMEHKLRKVQEEYQAIGGTPVSIRRAEPALTALFQSEQAREVFASALRVFGVQDIEGATTHIERVINVHAEVVSPDDAKAVARLAGSRLFESLPASVRSTGLPAYVQLTEASPLGAHLLAAVTQWVLRAEVGEAAGEVTAASN